MRNWLRIIMVLLTGLGGSADGLGAEPYVGVRHARGRVWADRDLNSGLGHMTSVEIGSFDGETWRTGLAFTNGGVLVHADDDSDVSGVLTGVSLQSTYVAKLTNGLHGTVGIGGGIGTVSFDTTSVGFAQRKLPDLSNVAMGELMVGAGWSVSSDLDLQGGIDLLKLKVLDVSALYLALTYRPRP